MIFYTDTNGYLPYFRSTVLIMLGIVMDSAPLNEIDFVQFKRVAPAIVDYDSSEQ